MTDDRQISEVIDFWREAGPASWFTKSAEFDDRFRSRFLTAHMAAARREHDGWATTGDGLLALLILLDQFPRNCFRGTGHMYATDPLARLHAHAGVERGLDQALEPALRLFCYLPFVHSEDLAEQDLACRLADTLGPETASHAHGHRDIIRRFGRFPHRNPLLARSTTAEEQVFLDQGGFAG